MPESVLVDSNVFIGLLRRRVDPAVVLGAWIGDGDLVTCGMVRLEVERGLKVPKLRKHLSGFFDVMIFGSTSVKTWELATQLAWQLDRRGRVLPAQDLLIATIALEMGVSILTEDAHFEGIPGLKILSPAEEFPEW